MVFVKENDLSDSRNQEIKTGHITKVRDLQAWHPIPEEAVSTQPCHEPALLLKRFCHGCLSIIVLKHNRSRHSFFAG